MDSDVVIVLPDGERDGVGVYPEDELFMVKRLCAEGVNAQFQHDPEHRLFRCLRSDPGYAVFLLNVATGVASSAVYSLLATAIRRNRDRKMHVRFTRRSRPDGTVEEQFEATGPAAEVQDAFDSYWVEHSKSDVVAVTDPSAERRPSASVTKLRVRSSVKSTSSGRGEEHARRALALASSAYQQRTTGGDQQQAPGPTTGRSRLHEPGQLRS